MTYKDRLKVAKDLKKEGKEDWTVLVDAMDDRTQKAWGNLPNMGYLINPHGRIAQKWSWVSSSTGKARKNGDEDTRDVYTLLKEAGDLTPYSVADDPQLPLYDTRDGEWIKYGDETVTFTPAGENKVKRGAETIELKAPELPDKRAKPKTETLKVGELKLPCIVVVQDSVETWYSSWLPGDGVAKVVQDGKVVREVTDAGFEKGKSCLVEYDPEPKK